MPLKDLLVCYDRTDAGYARLELAFNLARASRAYLAGAYVLPEAHVSPAGSVGFGFGPPAGMTGPAAEGVSAGRVLREAEAAEAAEQHFTSSTSRASCGSTASRANGTSWPMATRRR